MLKIFGAIAVAALISYLFVPVSNKIANKIGAIDVPKDDRRMHTYSMPRLGGLAIYLSVLICTLVFTSRSHNIIIILLGSTVVLIAGIIDDSKGLSPKQKIMFQFAAAIILVAGGVRIEFITNPFSAAQVLVYIKYIGIPITIFWLIGISNTVNLIDGLDGLAGGLSMIAAFALMIIAHHFGRNDIVFTAAIIGGACLGFLPYNMNPASVIMGDTGALFLGFILAAISIEGVIKSAAAVALLAPIIILGVPIFDTTFAIIRRVLSGKSMSEADKGHIHHRLIKMGNTHKKTVFILYGVGLVFALCSVLITYLDSNKGVYFSFILICVAIALAILMGLLSKES